MSKVFDARWNFSLQQEYPLHSAATTGNWELFQHLMKLGYGLTDLNDRGDAPLHCAASEGRLEIIQHVANLKIDKAVLNHLNSKGLTPLAVACGEGQLECAIKLLKTKYCKVNQKYERSSALHEAVASENVDCVELLISNGCNIDKLNEYGETALHVAIRAVRITRMPDTLTLETIECIKLLVDAGKASVNAIFNGSTPLHFAAAARCEGLLRYLVASGAGTNMRNSHGCRAIDFLDECDPLYHVLQQAGQISFYDESGGFDTVDSNYY